jgi:hypothetical protein
MKKTTTFLALSMLLFAIDSSVHGKTIILKIGTSIKAGMTPPANQIGGIDTQINVPAGAAPRLVEGGYDGQVDITSSGVAAGINSIVDASYTAGANNTGGTIHLVLVAQGQDNTTFGFGEFATIVFDAPDGSTTKDSDFIYVPAYILGADGVTDLMSTVDIMTAKEKDFNRNSKADILWRNASTGQNSFWLMNDTAIRRELLLASHATTSWEIGGIGDFNADGKPDILWRNPATGQNQISLMNDTSVTSDVTIQSLSGTSWSIGGTGDFNTDGKPDILWRNSSTGQNMIWYMNGTSVAGTTTIRSLTSASWGIGGTGDFDGDGKPDILWRNSSTGQNTLWLMDGPDYRNSASIPSRYGGSWRVGGIGDFDADGKPDILWRNSSTAQNDIWFMNGTIIKGGALIESLPYAYWSIELH